MTHREQATALLTKSEKRSLEILTRALKSTQSDILVAGFRAFRRLPPEKQKAYVPGRK